MGFNSYLLQLVGLSAGDRRGVRPLRCDAVCSETVLSGIPTLFRNPMPRENEVMEAMCDSWRSRSGSPIILASIIIGKWVFPVNGGYEVDLGKNGLENKNTQKPCLDGSHMKEVVSQVEEKKTQVSQVNQLGSTLAAAKAQVVGWPPVRSFHKNTMATNLAKKSDDDGKSDSGSSMLRSAWIVLHT